MDPKMFIQLFLLVLNSLLCHTQPVEEIERGANVLMSDDGGKQSGLAHNKEEHSIILKWLKNRYTVCVCSEEKRDDSSNSLWMGQQTIKKKSTIRCGQCWSRNSNRGGASAWRGKREFHDAIQKQIGEQIELLKDKQPKHARFIVITKNPEYALQPSLSDEAITNHNVNQNFHIDAAERIDKSDRNNFPHQIPWTESKALENKANNNKKLNKYKFYVYKVEPEDIE